ncbi:Fe-S cluster assembly ATPase SufC [Candidatus Peregrinibacteria bacterium]|nr:Fe-S cluster assembly ATPase SufC [Candidatus Peregrinibacteria bacterium]
MTTTTGIKTRKKTLKKHKRPALNTLEIKNIHAEADDKKILNGINLKISSGEIHVIMGPNGSGKSTLCKTLMGHPKCNITKGKILLNNQEIHRLKPNKRANLGIFLAFQNPIEIPGVTFRNLIRLSINENEKALNENTKQIGPVEFLKKIKDETKSLKMDQDFTGRNVNEGLSGGEKKKAEILQMAALKPKIILLDEIDSGLDIDALKTVSAVIKKNFQKSKPAILLITHYQRILNYISPDRVHIISGGKIIKSGSKNLAKKLEKEGYNNFLNKITC